MDLSLSQVEDHLDSNTEILSKSLGTLWINLPNGTAQRDENSPPLRLQVGIRSDSSRRVKFRCPLDKLKCEMAFAGAVH